MGEKAKRKAKRDERERKYNRPLFPLSKSMTNKYRIFFSLYCTGGFLLLCWIYTYIGLIIYRKHPQFWGVESGTTPPYPFGALILFLGIPLFALVHWRGNILNYLLKRDTSLTRTFYVFLVFNLTIFISLINFGFNLYFIFEGFIFSISFGLMDGILSYKEDFSFLSTSAHSESKLSKLQMMHQRWSNALIAIIATIIGLLIAIGVQGIVSTPEPIRGENTILLTMIEVYLFVGMVLGILWDVFNKMKEIENKSLEIMTKINNGGKNDNINEI